MASAQRDDVLIVVTKRAILGKDSGDTQNSARQFLSLCGIGATAHVKRDA